MLKTFAAYHKNSQHFLSLFVKNTFVGNLLCHTLIEPGFGSCFNLFFSSKMQIFWHLLGCTWEGAANLSFSVTNTLLKCPRTLSHGPRRVQKMFYCSLCTFQRPLSGIIVSLFFLILLVMWSKMNLTKKLFSCSTFESVPHTQLGRS